MGNISSKLRKCWTCVWSSYLYVLITTAPLIFCLAVRGTKSDAKFPRWSTGQQYKLDISIYSSQDKQIYIYIYIDWSGALNIFLHTSTAIIPHCYINPCNPLNSTTETGGGGADVLN